MTGSPSFREIWLCDFEFRAPEGERPWPVCMVAREHLTGREIRLWREDLIKLRAAPFNTGHDALFLAYFASAELGCFLALDWPLPVNVLDLFAEHRCATNGYELPCGNSLLGALALRRLDHLEGSQKEAMRGLVMRQSAWTDAEAAAILDYCADDTRALGRLFDWMAAALDWPRALLRGRYMAAVARMERVGIPIDIGLWRAFSAAWEPLKAKLIETVDVDYGVYDGTSFRIDRFLGWLGRVGLDWPLYPSGHPQLDSDTFRDQARVHAIVGPLHELRSTTAKLRLTGLAIGADGRNRCLLSPFGASSGRNTPSNSKFIFGPAVWMRGLIQPPPDHGLAYIDWSGQEIAIAGALSGDERMIDGYRSGDPHMAFARANRLAPPEATSLTHPAVRESCKTVNLGVNYGMTAVGLAARLGIIPAAAQELLRLHHETYRRFWTWVEETVSAALLSNRMISRFGWQLHVTAGINARSLQNFPMQSNGAEMLRIAAIGATEAGIDVAAPVHDAFLIVAPLERLEDDVAAMREIMRKAGLAVTGGLEVRTDVKIVRSPDRYMDGRGAAMWARATGLLREVSRAV
jgi:hypothetical protein